MAYIEEPIKVRVLDDDCIYHYTSAQALQGILDNEEFWATRSSFLNDEMEFKYTYKLFEDHFLLNIDNPVLRKKFVDAYRFEIERCHPAVSPLSEKSSGYYVISFSTNPDSLLLWSEFSNLMGYNLEFRVVDLAQSFQGKIRWQGEVIYDKEAQLQCLQYTLDESLAGFFESRSIRSLNDLERHDSDSDIALLVPELYVFTTVYSMFFKRPEFAQEEEYRFIFPGLHEVDERNRERKKMHFRVKDDSLIPYIKVPCKPLAALQTITIGPKNNIDIAAAGIECYCREKRIEVPVKKSNIPLRY